MKSNVINFGTYFKTDKAMPPVGTIQAALLSVQHLLDVLSMLFYTCSAGFRQILPVVPVNIAVLMAHSA